STTCSWVNMLGGPKAAIIARVGQFYSDAVGQYYSGANSLAHWLFTAAAGNDKRPNDTPSDTYGASRICPDRTFSARRKTAGHTGGPTDDAGCNSGRF
ncbi:MAG: hypothetical protein ACREYD_06430, partial [Casimicrobiaceae bacterium]